MNNRPDDRLAKAEADLKKEEAAIRRADDTIERATKEKLEAIENRDEIAAYIRRSKMYEEPSNVKERHQKSATDETMAESLEAILSASSEPMLVPEILSALTARGRKLTAANPMAHVSSILSRSQQFKFEKGRGWTFQVP